MCVVEAEFRDRLPEFETNAQNFVREIDKLRIIRPWWEQILPLEEPAVVLAKFKDAERTRELEGIEHFLRGIDESDAAEHVREMIFELEDLSQKARVVAVTISGNKISRINKAISDKANANFPEDELFVTFELL